MTPTEVAALASSDLQTSLMLIALVLRCTILSTLITGCSVVHTDSDRRFDGRTIRVDYAQDNRGASSSRGGGHSSRGGPTYGGGRGGGGGFNPRGGFSGGGGFAQQGQQQQNQQQQQYPQDGGFGSQQGGTNFGP